eukprot:403371501
MDMSVAQRKESAVKLISIKDQDIESQSELSQIEHDLIEQQSNPLKYNSLNELNKQDSTTVTYYDDDFYEPTEKPDINRHDQNQIYITTKNAPQESILYDVTNQNFYPQSIEDFQHNYLFIKDKQGLCGREILDKYLNDYYDEQEKMASRIIQNQTILQSEAAINKLIVQNQEDDIMSYLKINSKQYQNIIGVSKIARGGESIVFRLDYAGVEEVVIKKSVIDTSTAKSEMMKQMVFTGMMSETQQLKLLQSDKFIAQVKEEIIEYDPQTHLINDYLVIVERARFSLNDLLKIWNDEDLRSRYYEIYSPEKLAYYFYQAMQIMAYLHQRNVYYGDMKPHNLLVFKDQLVKVGDLGITIKLDNSIPDDQKAYYFKGMSLQHASQKTINDFHKTVPQSKNELMDCDIYSLISTFQKCIQYTSNLKSQSENKDLCQNILNDLINSKDLLYTLKKWSKNLQNESFVQNLISQMKDENKIESIYHIAYLTKYKLIFEGQLLPIVKNCENQTRKQMTQSQIDKLDYLINYYDSKDFIQLDDNLQSEQTKSLMRDLDFKQHILDILSSLKLIQQEDGSTLNESQIVIQTFGPYFKQYGKYEYKKNQHYGIGGLEQFITNNEDNYYQRVLFFIITKQKDEVLRLEKKIENLPKSFELRKKFIRPLQFEKIRIYQGQEESDESEISDEEIIIQYKAASYNDILFPCIEPLSDYQEYNNNVIEYFKEQFNVDIICLNQNKDFFTNNYVNLAFLYIDILKRQNNFEEALKESQIWLQKYRDLCGDSHIITLKLFGIVGELLIQKDLEKGETYQEGLNFLIKYSKLNLNTYCRFLLLLETLNLYDIILENLPPFYHLQVFDKYLYQNMIASVFSGKYDEQIVLQTLEFIYQDQNSKSYQEKLMMSDDIENIKFVWTFATDNDQFNIFMRYLESIKISPEFIEFTHTTTINYVKEENGRYEIPNKVGIILDKIGEILDAYEIFKENKAQLNQQTNTLE